LTTHIHLHQLQQTSDSRRPVINNIWLQRWTRRQKLTDRLLITLSIHQLFLHRDGWLGMTQSSHRSIGVSWCLIVGAKKEMKKVCCAVRRCIGQKRSNNVVGY